MLKQGETPVIHSDIGRQYRKFSWINMMNDNDLIISISKKGCSPNNLAF